MEKIIIPVPKSVRYISDWSGFSLPENPSILNKQITGCGFTEWCITNDKPSILCSPRKILLENKEEQHSGEVLYVRNELDRVLDVDRDLSLGKPNLKAAKKEEPLSDEEKSKIKTALETMKNNIITYYFNCVQSCKPCKILTTYDSFRHVKDALGSSIEQFDIVVDEFQSIFTDSKFKSDTELEFLNYLRDLKKVYFVSATPMMDEYLEMLSEFKDLPYYVLDWKAENPGRIIKPQLDVISCQRILDAAERAIRPYLSGNFEKSIFVDSEGKIQEIESRELVIYVNSVKNICDIIRRNGLTYDNTNVLCANTSDNKQKIRRAFGFTKKSDPSGIGKVPKRGEPHKMFTLCTRTVYLGADFYSTCAKSLILSDANVDSLAVDITLDLPQILGRQRLEENPWKNRATLYYRSVLKKNVTTAEDFKKFVQTKMDRTESLLRSYGNALDIDKHNLADNYQYVAKTKNYRDDYVAVNVHGGKDLVPVINNLVLVSEIRAFEIQQVDYKDRFSVFKAISDNIDNDFENKILDFVEKFNKITIFSEKMRLLCLSNFSDSELSAVLELIPILYKNYYNTLGKSKIGALSYKKHLLDKECSRILNNQGVASSCAERIVNYFCIGNRYLKTEIKQALSVIYKDTGLDLTPKASDLEKYFELKEVNLVDHSTNKRVKGFEILSKKE